MNDNNFNYYGYACWFFSNNYSKKDIDKSGITKLYRFKNAQFMNKITWQKPTHISAIYNLFSPFIGDSFDIGVDFNKKKMYVMFPIYKKININKINEMLPFVEVESISNDFLKKVLIINFSKIGFYNDYYFKMKENQKAENFSIFEIQRLDKIGALPTLPKIESAQDQLNKLIGINKAKEQINKMVSLNSINQTRKNRGLKVNTDFSKHMIFVGNPGTGKTTVAKLVSEILYDEKIISKKNPVIVSANDLLKSNGYSGTIETNFEKIIKQSIGGILFIDEAYSLIPSKNDNGNWNIPGKNIISMLLSYMEKYRDNLIVIMAGYNIEINNMLNANPGLKSRFTNEIIFDDFSKQDMYKILIKLIDESNIIRIKNSDFFRKQFFKYLNENSINGNGRGIRNLYERLCMNQALRVSQIKNPSNEQLEELSNSDIIKTFEG